jgi:hypothetical protein
MLSSEFIVGVVLGSLATGLCLCLLTLSIVIYICRNRLSSRHGVPRLFGSASNKNSDCEKCHVEFGEPHERYQDEKKSESAVIEVPVVDTPLVDVEETHDSKYFSKTECFQKSDAKVETIAVQDPWNHDDQNPHAAPEDRVALVRALVTAKDNHAQQQFKSLVDGCQLKDFDSTPWLCNPSTPPIFLPSVPTAVSSKRSRKPIIHKAKRWLDTSNEVLMNSGSIQVKGIRDLGEDRPIKRDY